PGGRLGGEGESSLSWERRNMGIFNWDHGDTQRLDLSVLHRYHLFFGHYCSLSRRTLTGYKFIRWQEATANTIYLISGTRSFLISSFHHTHLHVDRYLCR